MHDCVGLLICEAISRLYSSSWGYTVLLYSFIQHQLSRSFHPIIIGYCNRADYCIYIWHSSSRMIYIVSTSRFNITRMKSVLVFSLALAGLAYFLLYYVYIDLKHGCQKYPLQFLVEIKYPFFYLMFACYYTYFVEGSCYKDT